MSIIWSPYTKCALNNSVYSQHYLFCEALSKESMEQPCNYIYFELQLLTITDSCQHDVTDLKEV